MSLRTGGVIGTATSMIVNPNNLKVEGWYVTDRYSKDQLILVASEVREMLERGIAVNDHEVLSRPDELIRLQPINFLQRKRLAGSGRPPGRLPRWRLSLGR